MSSNGKSPAGLGRFLSVCVLICIDKSGLGRFADYAVSNGRVMRFLWKSCKGILCFFLLICLVLFWFLYYRGFQHGWVAYENSIRDAVVKEYSVLPESERQKKYQADLVKYDGDAKNLASRGDSAFRNGDPDATVRFYEKMLSYQGDGTDDSASQGIIFYAGALIQLQRQDEAKKVLQKLNDEIDRDINHRREPNYDLGFEPSLNGMANNCSEVRQKLRPEDQSIMDNELAIINAKKAEVRSLNNPKE
jgi:hypothetical protein